MDSPFTSRLDSNYVATDSESLEIQSFLKPHTSRLEELSTQLQELEDQCTQIRNEQSSLRLFISKHRALTSLIRRLPIDVLQEIFIACIPTAHNAVMSRWEAPILLTQVCSSWRNVAHATPQLWKSIHVAVPCIKPAIYASYYSNFSSPPVEQIDLYSEAVLEWLSRSAACPLDISLGSRGETTPDGFYDKIIDSFIRFSERWRKVRFSAPYQAVVPVATLPTSKVPLLETLTFDFVLSTHFTESDPPSRSVLITSGVLKAPKLRGLCLRDLRLAHLTEDVTVMRLPINWGQLTNISLEGTFYDLSTSSLPVSMAYKLLSLCRNLITCRLEIGKTRYGEELLETTAALISLPFLTSLSVHEGYTNLSRLFTLLHLPSLNCIEFHTTGHPTHHSRTSLLSLLTHSSFHNTTYLTTDAQFITRQDFIKCLRLCPLLKSLSVRKAAPVAAPSVFVVPAYGCKVDDAFLMLFIESSNDEGYLCPHLEDFESSSKTAFSETALLQFVKKKNDDSTTALAKLKHLFVIFNSLPLGDINQELEPYKQAGLVATVTYPLTPPLPGYSGYNPYYWV